MLETIYIFIAGFGSVFLLGFQSRNVNHSNYGWAAMTGFCIALMQTTLWGTLFHNMTWANTVAYGLSGALGITASMLTHSHLILKTKGAAK